MKRRSPSIVEYHDPNENLPVPLVTATQLATVTHLNKFGLAEVIKIGIIAVEEYSAAQKEKLPGTSKLELCKQVLPIVIQAAVEGGATDAITAMRLQARIDSGLDAIDDFINAFVAISKNPHFVQFREEVAAKCCKPPKAKKTKTTATE